MTTENITNLFCCKGSNAKMFAMMCFVYQCISHFYLGALQSQERPSPPPPPACSVWCWGAQAFYIPSQ
jgi:hypothetical protein